ncbi:MAG: ABC transporter ATP-binding protein [Proteobacteria bacterium]|nr:ABC transporter ATP-binding protein [Pseudomonadota bacterium]
MTRIEAEGVEVALGGRKVLAGADLRLAAGEVVGLVGPNGAGKTTWLRALAGLLPLNAGEVRLEGRALLAWSRRERARRLAYLPQDAPCHWPMRIGDVVMLGRMPRLRPWVAPARADEEAVARALAAVDAAHLAERRIDSVSAGERARVMLARALAAEPSVLLADEPVAGLDPGHQLKVMRLLRGLAAEGRSVLVTLHDLTHAVRFCDRLVLLSGGRVLAEGPPEDVLTAERLAAAFAVRAEFGRRGGEPYLVPWEGIDGDGPG